MLFGFYFLVANYGTDDEQQGRGTARMRQQGGQYGNKVPSLFVYTFLLLITIIQTTNSEGVSNDDDEDETAWRAI